MAEPIVLGIVSIKNMGDYDNDVSYEKLNVVTYQGSSYCAIQNTKGNLPTDPNYWQLYAQKGDVGDTGPQGPKPVKGVDYYTTEDKLEIESDLADDISDAVSESVGSLVSATPLAASSTAEMTDTTRIYVNSTDGYWYYYDGDSWEQGGIYQATAISDTDPIIERIDDSISNESIGEPTYVNKVIPTSGSTVDLTDVRTFTGYKCWIINCQENDVFTITGTGGSTMRLWCFIDSLGNNLLKAEATHTATKEAYEEKENKQ